MSATKNKKPNRDEQRRARQIVSDRSISYQSAIQEVQGEGSPPVEANTSIKNSLSLFVSDADCIAALRAVALATENPWLSMPIYDEFRARHNKTLPKISIILQRFQTWRKAVEAAGLLGSVSLDVALGEGYEYKRAQREPQEADSPLVGVHADIYITFEAIDGPVLSISEPVVTRMDIVEERECDDLYQRWIAGGKQRHRDGVLDNLLKGYETGRKDYEMARMGHPYCDGSAHRATACVRTISPTLEQLQVKLPYRIEWQKNDIIEHMRAVRSEKNGGRLSLRYVADPTD